jgi:hypothetical protein
LKYICWPGYGDKLRINLHCRSDESRSWRASNDRLHDERCTEFQLAYLYVCEGALRIECDILNVSPLIVSRAQGKRLLKVGVNPGQVEVCFHNGDPLNEALRPADNDL